MFWVSVSKKRIKGRRNPVIPGGEPSVNRVKTPRHGPPSTKPDWNHKKGRGKKCHQKKKKKRGAHRSQQKCVSKGEPIREPCLHAEDGILKISVRRRKRQKRRRTGRGGDSSPKSDDLRKNKRGGRKSEWPEKRTKA